MEVAIVLVSTAEDLGRLLREARKRAGMTQAELAGRIATSRQWVISAEAGSPTSRLDLMLDALRTVDLLVDVSPDEGEPDLDLVLAATHG